MNLFHPRPELDFGRTAAQVLNLDSGKAARGVP